MSLLADSYKLSLFENVSSSLETRWCCLLQIWSQHRVFYSFHFHSFHFFTYSSTSFSFENGPPTLFKNARSATRLFSVAKFSSSMSHAFSLQLQLFLHPIFQNHHHSTTRPSQLLVFFQYIFSFCKLLCSFLLPAHSSLHWATWPLLSLIRIGRTQPVSLEPCCLLGRWQAFLGLWGQPGLVLPVWGRDQTDICPPLWVTYPSLSLGKIMSIPFITLALWAAITCFVSSTIFSAYFTESNRSFEINLNAGDAKSKSFVLGCLS